MGSEDSFLVAYGYGQGATWAFVRAPSREGVATALPKLTVLTEWPTWMTAAVVAGIETIDLDQPTGFIKVLLDARRS